MANLIQKITAGWLLALGCFCAQANTAGADDANKDAQPEVRTFSVPAPAASSPPAAATSAPNATPAPAPAATEERPPRRIALLLPLHSETLGSAAEVLRQGFMAAHDIQSDGVSVDVVESGDSGPDVLDNYQLALSQHDVIVGPLSRAGVETLIASGGVSKPTLALNYPEKGGERLPPNLLLMGLSLEDEARQTAHWAAHNLSKGARALVLSSNVAWQRRAAKAFAQQWQKLGMEAVQQEIWSSSGFLSAAGLEQLKKRLSSDKLQLIYIALDAEQTRQVRNLLPAELLQYGNSQLNRIALQDLANADPALYLDGVRLLDIPWQFQRDHAAVMVYPRLLQNAEQKRSADLERLYGLGIDAYRLARLLALQNGQNLELDGVTGHLQVKMQKNGFSFERQLPQAVFRQGVLQNHGLQQLGQ